MSFLAAEQPDAGAVSGVGTSVVRRTSLGLGLFVVTTVACFGLPRRNVRE